MTIKLASLQADLQREAEGEWKDYPDWPGIRFNVRSLQYPAYQVARDLLLQKLARIHKGKPVPPHEMTSAIGGLYADHILLGWDGLDVAFSSAVARECLTDPAYRKVVAAVEWCAARVGESEIEFVEELAKNSEEPSATT